jgi:hypothetical protein
MTSPIKKIIASVEELHGGTREQIAKHDSFISCQIRQRMSAKGMEAPSSLRNNIDDPHDQMEAI